MICDTLEPFFFDKMYLMVIFPVGFTVDIRTWNPVWSLQIENLSREVNDPFTNKKKDV